MRSSLLARSAPHVINPIPPRRCIPDLYGDEWYVETTNVGLGPSPANTTSTSSTGSFLLPSTSLSLTSLQFPYSPPDVNVNHVHRYATPHHADPFHADVPFARV